MVATVDSYRSQAALVPHEFLVQRRVAASLGQQFLMCASLDDFALLHCIASYPAPAFESRCATTKQVRRAKSSSNAC